MASCPSCGASYGPDDFAFEGRAARCGRCGVISTLVEPQSRPAKVVDALIEDGDAEQAEASLGFSPREARPLAVAAGAAGGQAPSTLGWTVEHLGTAWVARLTPTPAQRRRGRQAFGLALVLGAMATFFFLLLPLRAWIVGVLPMAMVLMAIDLVRTALRLTRGVVQLAVGARQVTVHHGFGGRRIELALTDVATVDVVPVGGPRAAPRSPRGFDLAVRLSSGRRVPLGLEIDLPLEAEFVRAELAAAIAEFQRGRGYR
jgi:hypothetical protein